MTMIRMIASIGGYSDGVEIPQPGGEVDLPARTAAEFIAQGYAVAVDDIVVATPEPIDRAVITGKRNKR
jgi:hypothetical protein